ncbi:MAG: response regulator [Candidatus Omnitrophica bacterium]|nr:response regulator [Candidatus Omnitrophota bacterium]
MEKKKILLIDDEVSFVEMVKLSLDDLGIYEVKAEYSGKLGLETAEKFLPDLIILDMMMPDINGMEVLEELRKYEDTEKTPVVVLSALKSELLKRASAQCYGEFYLEKPILFIDLLKKIEEILDSDDK